METIIADSVHDVSELVGVAVSHLEVVSLGELEVDVRSLVGNSAFDDSQSVVTEDLRSLLHVKHFSDNVLAF